MKFARILQEVYYRPWYIESGAHASIHQLVDAKLPEAVNRFSEIAEEFVLQRKPMTIDREGIATIEVKGPMGRHLAKIEKSCGATSMDEVMEEIAEAQNRARGILLLVRSPGGTVAGTPELADAVSGSKIPVVAYTDDFMASGAYYISAGASRIVASRSAVIGSIGVLVPWVDYSEYLKQKGIRPDPITNKEGIYKATGFSGILSQDQRDYVQESVDRSFQAFRAHVTTYRDVPDEAMRGQTFYGDDAVAVNLVDEVGDIARARSYLLSLT